MPSNFRHQAILTLVQARRLHPMLPLKPYLSHLVELLEDTDGTVRECARQSVVELFTGPTVTDAARTDLKKEMTKKNVRKAIVDSVLQKLMEDGTRPSSSPGNQPHDEVRSEASDPTVKKEYIPPSLKLQGRLPSASSTQNLLGKSTSNSASIADSTSRPASRIGEDPITPVTDSGEVVAVYVCVIQLHVAEHSSDLLEDCVGERSGERISWYAEIFRGSYTHFNVTSCGL